MRVHRIGLLVAFSTLFVVLTAAVITPSVQAAPKPGAKCPKAGIEINGSNSALRCVKKGGKLVWVKVSSEGASGGSSSSIKSNADIPKVIQNWGLALDPYDAATGKAGVMQLAGVTPPTFSNPTDTAAYSRIVILYGDWVQDKKTEPQMTFIAPLGTPVISMLDGTVCDLPQLYSNDYSVRVAPKGMACQTGGAPILFEHEHLINPVVKVGDKVRAGQRLGTVGDFNSNWKAKGMGILETGVFFSKEGSNVPWHACLANYLAPSKKASMTSVLTSIENAWISIRNDPSLYSLAAQNPIGCLTQEDITDQ